MGFQNLQTMTLQNNRIFKSDTKTSLSTHEKNFPTKKKEPSNLQCTNIAKQARIPVNQYPNQNKHDIRCND